MHMEKANLCIFIEKRFVFIQRKQQLLKSKSITLENSSEFSQRIFMFFQNAFDDCGNGANLNLNKCVVPIRGVIYCIHFAEVFSMQIHSRSSFQQAIVRISLNDNKSAVFHHQKGSFFSLHLNPRDLQFCLYLICFIFGIKIMSNFKKRLYKNWRKLHFYTM